MTMIFTVILGNHTYTVNAATTTEDHGFTIDENLFNVNWTETGKVYVYQTVRSTNSKFDKGVDLGYVFISAGFATSKNKIDGKKLSKSITTI